MYPKMNHGRRKFLNAIGSSAASVIASSVSLLKVRVRPDKSFTARYPAEFPSQVTVRLKNGRSFSHEVSNYPGFPTRPFTWEEISAKFDKLVAGHVGAQLSRDIKNAVRSLENIEVSDLTKLLEGLN